MKLWAARSAPGLHVDGVGVLLAQRLVFLWVEGLPLQVHVADLQRDSSGLEDKLGHSSEQLWPNLGSYRAHKAGVVPGVAKSLDELISSLHREVAAVTFGAEEGDVIWREEKGAQL